MICNWTITVTPGYFIYLHFEHFHLEHAYGASECPYDFVEIFDGSSSSSPLIAKRCDYQDSWCVYSTSNVLHVNFVSDIVIAQTGFSAYYERVHTRYPMCLYLNASKWMTISPPSKSYILMSSIMTTWSYTVEIAYLWRTRNNLSYPWRSTLADNLQLVIFSFHLIRHKDREN